MTRHVAVLTVGQTHGLQIPEIDGSWVQHSDRPAASVEWSSRSYVRRPEEASAELAGRRKGPLAGGEGRWRSGDRQSVRVASRASGGSRPQPSEVQPATRVSVTVLSSLDTTDATRIGRNLASMARE